MTHRWHWRKWLPERHGQLCRVLKTGRMNSALVEFEDGTKVVTIRYAVQKLTHKEAKPMTEGELWSWVRSVMSQGADIRLDYDHGTHKTYEHYSMRLDVAAAERADELWARLKTPNAK
jgi:hypothetical protein